MAQLLRRETKALTPLVPVGEALRNSFALRPSPQRPTSGNILLDFLQTTYEAAANFANWDRSALERSHDPKSAIKNT
jgi:hypothetical protein